MESDDHRSTDVQDHPLRKRIHSSDSESTPDAKHRICGDDVADKTSGSSDDQEDEFWLPKDVLIYIIAQHVPMAQWPSLERVNRGFQAATFEAWRRARTILLDEDLTTREKLKSGGTARLDSILDKLLLRAPNIASLGGFLAPHYFWLRKSSIDRLRKFQNLECVSFARSGSVVIPAVVNFLRQSASRHCLTKLDVSGCHFEWRGHPNDSFQLVGATTSGSGKGSDTSDRSPEIDARLLRILDFDCSNSSTIPSDVLDLLDLSPLTVLRLTGTKPRRELWLPCSTTPRIWNVSNLAF